MSNTKIITVFTGSNSKSHWDWKRDQTIVWSFEIEGDLNSISYGSYEVEVEVEFDLTKEVEYVLDRDVPLSTGEWGYCPCMEAFSYHPSCIRRWRIRGGDVWIMPPTKTVTSAIKLHKQFSITTLFVVGILLGGLVIGSTVHKWNQADTTTITTEY